MKRLACFAALCAVLVGAVLHVRANAGATGTITNYTNSGAGWTADLSWAVSFPDGAGVVTLSWNSSNGKHGSKLIRGAGNESHRVTSQQGDVVIFALRDPSATRWISMSIPADVTIG